MNWERAKTILIVMFLAVDIFLMAVLCQSRIITTRLKDSVVDETISILQNNHITVAKEVIPTKRDKNQSIVMRNYFEEPQRIASKMLGQCDVIQSDSELHEYLYKTKTQTLSVKGMHFTYEYSKADIQRISGEATAEKNGKALQEQALNLLGKLGFDKKIMFVTEGKIHEGLYKCKAIPLYASAKVYGVAMYVTMDAEDIVALEGVWFHVVSAETDEQEQLLDVTSVLAGLSFEQENDDMELTQVEYAFYVDDVYLENREIMATPIYAIHKKPSDARLDDDILFFDARTGAALGKRTVDAAETASVAVTDERDTVAEETME